MTAEKDFSTPARVAALTAGAGVTPVEDRLRAVAYLYQVGAQDLVGLLGLEGEVPVCECEHRADYHRDWACTGTGCGCRRLRVAVPAGEG